MIKKLFGETDEKQFMYLKPRLIALGVGIVLLLIGFLLMQVGISFGETIGSLGTGICVIVLFIFGWSIIRGYPVEDGTYGRPEYGEDPQVS